MQNKKGVSWSAGGKGLKIKIDNFDLFIVCCQKRFIYEWQGATRGEWLELATRFQEAKGQRPSIMAEYCMMKAGIRV